MTDNYKENILNYMIGNLQQQTGVNSPTFNNVDEVENNLKQQMSTYFTGVIYYSDFIPSKNNKNQNLDYSVFACNGVLTGSSGVSGAFVILDKDYNIVEFISHYSDGSLIGEISCINIDEEGNYYVIEQKNGNFYITDLNNIVLKLENQEHFQATKKRSIQIANAYTWKNFYKVFRDSGSNKYFMVADIISGGDEYMYGVHLSVGDTLEWTYYTSSYDIAFDMTKAFNNGFNVYWDSNGDVQFTIAVNQGGLLLLKKGSSTAMNEIRITGDNTGNSPYCNFIFYSNTYGYFASVQDSGASTVFKIYKINVQKNSVKEIYKKSSVYSARNQLWLFKNNNAIYFIRAAYNAVDYDLSFGLIDNTNIYEEDLGTFVSNTLFDMFCYPNIISSFNKNYVYIQHENDLFTLNFDWNNNNYNGSEFISYGSLVPSKASIEDENEVELFNRNLYNLSNYSNRYTATLQIPNYSLNNENLTTAILYSKNNNMLVGNTINTTKNIYEELYVNFINQFNILDKTTNYLNINASSSLVDGMINSTTNIYLSKFRIKYHDETTSIKTLSNNGITDLKTTFHLGVYVGKQIDSIELISEDENVIYKTINGSSLEIGKYYSITIDLKIE